MTDRELQLIMAAFENHREDVRAELSQQREFVKCEVGKYADLVKGHQKRFEAFDTVAHVAGRVTGWGSAIIAAVWAVFTFKWGK